MEFFKLQKVKYFSLISNLIIIALGAFIIIINNIGITDNASIITMRFANFAFYISILLFVNLIIAYRIKEKFKWYIIVSSLFGILLYYLGLNLLIPG